MKNMIRFAALICLCVLSFAASAGDRWMRWRGLDNARDLGGLQTTGSRLVRTNRIYRSQSFNDAAISDELTASRLKSGLVGATLPLIYGRANSDEIVVLINRDDLTAGCQAVANRLSADQSLWRTGAPRGTAESRAAILAATGLKTEIDLRNDSECYGMTGSPLGASVNWVHLPAGQTLGWYVTAEGKAFFKACFPYFLNEANYPIAIHGLCGAERTGRLAFVLGALLDVKEAQLTDDYALTSVTSGGSCSASTIRAEESAFASYSGSTLNERIAAYALDCGFSAEDLETYRALALEPEEEAGEEGGEGEDEDPTAGLPEDVERLEYIQSVGDAYIDTGVKINSETDEVEIDFEMTYYSTTTANGIFGSRIASANENYTLQFTSNANILFGCRANNSDTSHQLRLTDAAVKTRYIFRASQSSRSLTDAATSRVLASDTSSLVPFSSTENAYLFWANVEASWLKAKMKLYRCRIWREGELLRDFVPCRAVVDGEETVCLYDKESRDFFGAENGGSFMAPPKPHGKIRIVQICDPQFGFVTANIPDRTAANHEKYYAEDLASFRRMIPYVNAENADLVVIAGDLVQYSDELTRDWPDLLTQFKAPVLIVPGNHDLGQWNQAHTQYDSSTAYEQSYRDFVSFAGAGYGSRIIGNWRVVGMNSQFWQALDGSDYMNAQKGVHQDWYDGEVAAAKKSDQGLIVVSHVAPFVDSSNESDSQFNFPKSVRTTLMDQVIEAGGTSWLSGHSHLHRINTYGSLSIYIGEAMCANYANGGWPRGYTVLEVAAGSCEATWRDVTESEWRAAADDLLLHYRADTGVTTNDAGKVTAWKNLGTLGTAGDVVEVVDKDNASCPSDITLSAAGANGKPSVVFGGSSCLKTSGDIDFDTDSSRGACWFVALKSHIDYSKSANGCVMGLVDNVTTAKRFGAFHPKADVNKKHFAVYAFQDSASGGVQVKDCPDGWFVMSHSAWGSSHSSGYNGTYASFGKGLDGPAVGPFFAGKFGTLTWPIFVGEIAEIRCYSRALTPSERTAVQVEMGIYAESESIDFGSLDLFAAGNKVYTNDLAGFGTAPGIGKGEKCSAESGGLMACYADIPMSGANTLACLAHNGANDTGRVWCLAANKATAAEGHAHPLKLTSLTLNEGGTYALYYRSSTTERWTKLGDFIRDSPHSSPSIVLSAGWQDGYYRVKRQTGLCIMLY